MENIFQYADRMQRTHMPSTYGKPMSYDATNFTDEMSRVVREIAVDKAKSAKFRVAALEEKRAFTRRMNTRLSAAQLSKINSEIDAAEKTIETEAAGETGGQPETPPEVEGAPAPGVRKLVIPKWLPLVGIGAIVGIVAYTVLKKKK